MKTLTRSFVIPLILCLAGFQPVQAQVQLERISVTERGDGGGYVIRNHLSERPDSFQVFQPEANRIQLIIYAENLNAENVLKPEPFPGLLEIRYYESAGLFGYELYVQPEAAFRPFAYFDVNQRDVLVNLERTTRESLERAGYSAPFNFSEGSQMDEPAEEGAETPERPSVTPGVQGPAMAEREPQRERITAEIGIRAGYTSANFYGVGYSRNPRAGIAVATTVVVDFPFKLPYHIVAGLDTGFYFKQKGFENPQADKYIANRIEIDYIEIPVLLRLSVRQFALFSPHLLFGPYLGLMVSSEQVIGEDEIRRDLDEITRSSDVGWVIGAGLDLPLGEVILDFQIRSSLSFEPLFTDEAFDDGEKLRQFSLLFGIRF